MKLLDIDSTHHLFTVRYRGFLKRLTTTQFFYYTCFLKFPFEFLQSFFDVFAFFYWNYNHNYIRN